MTIQEMNAQNIILGVIAAALIVITVLIVQGHVGDISVLTQCEILEMINLVSDYTNKHLYRVLINSSNNTTIKNHLHFHLIQ